MRGTKKTMWVIMYSHKTQEFITFDIPKLDKDNSMEQAICQLIQIHIADFRKVMKSEYNAKLAFKRNPKQTKFYETQEPEWEYTEIYFEKQQDAERALGWINGQLLLYTMEHPGYSLKHM